MKREIFDIGIGGFPLHSTSSDGRSRRRPAIHQSRNLHDSGNGDAENSADNDAAEDPYADAHGEPLRCSKCDEYVAVHYHPQAEFPGHYAGFVAHCTCAAGPQLDDEEVEGLYPPWFLDVVQETEEDAEFWLRQYFGDKRDAEKWLDDSDEQ